MKEKKDVVDELVEAAKKILALLVDLGVVKAADALKKKSEAKAEKEAMSDKDEEVVNEV